MKGEDAMTISHHTFKVQSAQRPTIIDVTDRVEAALEESGVKDALLIVFSQHTTCSVMIQEASDDTDYWGTEFLMQDLLGALEKIAPTCRTQNQYLHPGPMHIEAALGRNEEASWSLNTDAHLRSVILGRSVMVPVENGSMILGEFGRIFFADFDHTRARERIVRVQVIGE